MDRKSRLLKRKAMLQKREKNTEKHAMCKQFSINVERMDIDEWIKTRNDNLESEMENIFGDMTNTPEEAVTPNRKKATLKSDNRLGKYENGMVLLPKSFYNVRSAKPTVTTRASIRNAQRGKRNLTKNKLFEQKFLKTYPSRISQNNNLKRTNMNVPKKQKIDTKKSEPEEDTVAKSEISLKNLSALIKPEILPSKLWEIDRIPPIEITIVENHEVSDNIEKSDQVSKMDVSNEINDENDKEIVELNQKNPSKPEDVIPMLTQPMQEDFPSIMDILNEKPVGDLTDDKVNTITSDDTEETKVNDTSCPQNTNEERIAEIPKNTEFEPVQNPDYILKTVIFKRYTENKESLDRLVTFQFNLDYSVIINDKSIELLGAPGIITGIEDMKILLQIVDDVSLDSFNIACKS